MTCSAEGPALGAPLDPLEALRSAGSNPIMRCFPGGGIVVFDHDLRYLSAGGVGLGDVNLSREILEGRTIYEIFPPDLLGIVESMFVKALAGEESTLDLAFNNRVYQQRCAPVHDDHGVIIAGMAFSQDVTDARRSEQILRESEDRFRLAFEHAPIGKALISIDGRYEQVNPALCLMTGYTEAQFKTLKVADITHPDDLTADVDARRLLLDGPSTSYSLEKRLVTASSQVTWVAKSVSLVRRKDGSPLHFVAQMQDITERKNQDQILSEERRRLRDAQAIGHIGSWELDLLTEEVTWSDTLFELYGLDPAEFAGNYEAALDCIHPDDREAVAASVEACAKGGVPIRTYYRVNRFDNGELRWIYSRGAAVHEHGQLVRLAGAIADVTDQVFAAKELEEARDAALEASRHKSAFLATMSHEIRTPMNAVIGMTGLLLDTSLDADQREFVETVRSSGDSLLSIINDILDFSKIEAGGLKLEKETFDLRACVEDCLDIIAATSIAKSLEVIARVDSSCPTHVVGDVTRLRQVLVNLLGNAVKFTSDGHVLLRVVADDPAADDPAAGSDVHLTISVTDTGIGIAPDRIAGLFDSFTQADASTTRIYGGTGLGLAISNRLVQAMGGELTVRSSSGVGSTFTFTIALGQCEHALTPLGAEIHTRLNGLGVLIVDDNPVSRQILQQQLSSWGMKVTEAANAGEAVDAVGSENPIDIALLDIKAPEIAVEELVSALRLSPAAMQLPIILLSNRTERFRLDESRLDQPPRDRSGGYAAVLNKPVRGSRLQETLLAVLFPGDFDGIAPASASKAEPVLNEPLRVLLAEDNSVNQRLGRLMLEKLGHRVDVVGNGREAVKAVGHVPYDLVLMDVEMPVMDGLAATGSIRSSRTAFMPPQIVALTASARIEDRKACADAGMDDYLAKPVRLQDLDDAGDKGDWAHQDAALPIDHGLTAR